MKLRRYRIYLITTLVIVFGGLAAVLFGGIAPRRGLDLEGGISIILTAQSTENVNEDVLEKSVEIIRQRIDALGVAEPEVAVVGSNNIAVQLPGVENQERALEVIGTTAQLTFREVVELVPPGGKRKDRPEVTQETDASVNDQEVVYPAAAEGDPSLYRLAPAALTGAVVTRALPSPPQVTGGGGWSVSLDMNDEGAEEWQRLTARQACQRDDGKLDQIAIVLDGGVVSAPGMDPQDVQCGQGISGGSSQITVGNEAEAKELALVLRYGALPLTLEQSEAQQISPTLGQESLEAGLTAGALGLGLVMLYVVLYYRGLGFILWAGLVVFAAANYVMLALLGEYAGLSLSLAGIAGIIVSIGVTSDSYIVAFERMKDEVRSGKSVRAAVERGMARALRTIVVADVVTGSAAVILFFLAVGPVRGFALTLGLATLIDVFIAFFFTRSSAHLLAQRRFFSGTRFVGIKEAPART
ncbi:MAG: protein translocase subunit SecD [Actinomycetota bacterium]